MFFSYQLYIDHARWWCPEVTPLLACSTKLGCSWITTQVALKTLIYEKWKNEIPPLTFPRWYLIWHKHKTHKEATFFWSILHRVVAMNKLHGRISVTIDKSCTYCGPNQVESMESMFFNCPLVQRVWRYHVNIIWQLLFLKEVIQVPENLMQ